MDKPIIHLPTCAKQFGKPRYLSSPENMTVFAEAEDQEAFHRFFRRYVHVAPTVMEVAAKAVAWLGLKKYSALHIDFHQNENSRDAAGTTTA
jgi:hypothetical protein